MANFSYTNWISDGYLSGISLTGKECVVFNCAVQPCRWIIGDCKKNAFCFICKAPLSDSYQLPSTTMPPRLRTFTGAQANKDNKNDSRMWKNNLNNSCLIVIIVCFYYCRNWFFIGYSCWFALCLTMWLNKCSRKMYWIFKHLIFYRLYRPSQREMHNSIVLERKVQL